jgi:hypothetical protein
VEIIVRAVLFHLFALLEDPRKLKETAKTKNEKEENVF